MSGAGTAVCGVAVAGSVVDFNSRLVVVAIHMEAHAVAPVLHGPGLHLHPLGHQIVAAENGGHPVQHMVAGLLYVIGHQVLKGQHTLGVQVAGAGDQIAGVGILRRQLVADQMTAVIQVLASTVSYFTVCQPLGRTWPISPRFSVGIVSLHRQAKATPQRPRLSSGA